MKLSGTYIVVAIAAFMYAFGMAFSLWGLIFAWLPAWGGIALLKSRKHWQAYQRTGHPAAAREACKQLGLAMKIGGIFALLLIVSFVPIWVFAAAFMASMGPPM